MIDLRPKEKLVETMPKSKRDYDDEYRKFHSSDEAKKDRAQRNKSRRDTEKEMGRDLPEDQHVHHKGGINNHGGGTVVISAKENMGNKDPDKDGGLGSRQKGSRRKDALKRKISRYSKA